QYAPSELESMRAHFPDAAAAIREWTEAASTYQTAVPELGRQLERRARDICSDLSGTSLVNFLESEAKWGLAHIDFNIASGRLVAEALVVASNTHEQWILGPAPSK